MAGTEVVSSIEAPVDASHAIRGNLYIDDSGGTSEAESKPIEDETNKLMNDHLDDDNIKFSNWGFSIDKLFDIAYLFYKRNENKAFHPGFDIRNQLNALILQAKFGNFDASKSPDIGALDLVGRSRRHEWTRLSGMSKKEAMIKFIYTLDDICPIFKAHAKAVKIYSDSQMDTDSRDSNEEQSEQHNLSQSNLFGLNDDDEQLKAIHKNLCRQTYNQFKQYAQSQNPNDPLKQREMLATLQEQYFQQYVSQMNPDIASSRKGKSHTKSEENSFQAGPPPPLDFQAGVAGPAPVQAPASAPTPAPAPGPIPEPPTKISERALWAYYNEEIDTSEAYEDEDLDDDDECSNPARSPLRETEITYEPLEAPLTWTKRGHSEFKESLVDDKQGGAYVVNQGILLTIQVPTYPDGRFIYWEFATDDYDIGFGVDFIYDFNLKEPLSISTYERFDEDEDEDECDETETETENHRQDETADGNDVPNSVAFNINSHNDNSPNFITSDFQSTATKSYPNEWPQAKPQQQITTTLDGNSLLTSSSSTTGATNNQQQQQQQQQASAGSERQAKRLDKRLDNLMILPTYRRDSHDEIQCGRHKYPGPGYYLLKFDNTYSVLRSKSLYFRVCYFM